MDKTKAAEIVSLAVAQDLEPTIKRDNANPPDFTITIAHPTGIPVNMVKAFQDTNNVTIKARVIDIT